MAIVAARGVDRPGLGMVGRAPRGRARPGVGPSLFLIAAAFGFLACSASSTPDPNSVKGRFDVGGRSLYLECSGTGSLTVVMDSGLGDTHTTWKAVAPALSGVRTCTYDRANLGASDAAPKPRSSADVVADLRALLKAAAIAPPYLLVGHSFGGISVRLYAATHPADIAGIVLVDPTPTGFVDGECAIVDSSLCAVLRQGWDPSKNPDGLDLAKSGEEIAQAGPLPKVPFVVLAATSHHQDAITDAAIEQQIESFWQEEEANLAASVPGGKVEVVSSGHSAARKSRMVLRSSAWSSDSSNFIARPAAG